MLRSGVRLRTREENSGFFSDNANSDDMNLVAVGTNATSPPNLKKKHRKKSKSDQPEKQVIEQSSSVETEEPSVGVKKKSKKSKNKHGKSTDVPDERKVIRGKRRLLQKQEHVEESISPAQKARSPPKTRSSIGKSYSSEDKENVVILLAPNENQIETSMEKYTKSPKVVMQKERVDAFDRSLDSSFEEYINADTTTTVKKSPRNTNRDTYEIIKEKSPLKDISTNSPKRELRSQRRSTFEIQKVDESLKSNTENTKQSKSSKRSTFEVPHEEDLEPKTKKRNTFEIKTTSPGTENKLQVKENEVEAKNDRRSTFDINANGILPLSKKKGTNVNTPTVVLPRDTRNTKRGSFKKTSSTLIVAKKSLTPSPSMKKRVSGKKDAKIKISDSLSSLTESGISSPSMLLRRARQLNPPSAKRSTPNLNLSVKIVSPKNKTPQRSTSKVKKVPNYSAIHQNAYDKMESLDVHLQRKADRAKALLSGQKVSIPGKRTPSVSQDAKTRKQLFSISTSMTRTRSSDIPVNPSFKFTTKPTNFPVTFGVTTTKKQIGAGDASDVRKTMDTPKKKAVQGNKSVGFNVTTPVTTRLQSKHVKTPRPTKEEIWNAYGTKIPVAKTNAPVITPSAVELPSSKLPVKSLRLKEVASVATKSKPSTVTLDSRRNHIKGVRSNRRFDLLMSMRK